MYMCLCLYVHKHTLIYAENFVHIAINMFSSETYQFKYSLLL